MAWCEKCSSYSLFSKAGECSCRTFIIIDEDGERYEERARDYEEALENYAREYEYDDDYHLVDNETDFLVKDSLTGETKTVCVSGETAVNYNARIKD